MSVRYKHQGANTVMPQSEQDKGRLIPFRRRAKAASLHMGVALPSHYERHIVFGDYHHRNYRERNWTNGSYELKQAHDSHALAVLEQFMADFEPTHIHVIGDMVDFFAISRFCKAKPDPDEIPNSLLAVKSILRRIRMAHPHAEMHYYLGNHEFRWQAYIEEHAEALSGIVGISYNEIFAAQDIDIHIHKYKQRVVILPGLLELTHGDVVRQKSGATAHAMLEKGVSGISGHTHRLAAVYRTARLGVSKWIENGCLCNTDPTYVANPDWQQGFTVMYVDRVEARFGMTEVPILQRPGAHRIVYGGEMWEVRDESTDAQAA